MANQGVGNGRNGQKIWNTILVGIILLGFAAGGGIAFSHESGISAYAAKTDAIFDTLERIEEKLDRHLELHQRMP